MFSDDVVYRLVYLFFFQAEDGIRDVAVTGVQTCALPISYKAESAGRKLCAVDPRGTSQTCVCGARVPKRLSDRVHVCTACGLMASRDHVSAQVILERARMVPSSANVGEVRPCVA